MQEQFPGGITQQADNSPVESNVYGIIQCALWCKGYATGSSSITKHFFSGTGDGVKALKQDMGIASGTATISVNVMEALLSMKQYVLVWGGDYKIRLIQQALNGNYEAYIGISPCDGLYGREMNDALIKVLQAIEGFTPEEATGNFGEGTKSRCPVLPDSTEPEATKLMKYALLCNGYALEDLSAAWTSETTSRVKAFQEEYCLEADGIAGLNTWMALLLSCGNPNRSAKACDCATVLNANKAKALHDAGYRYVGRYLTGAVGWGDNVRSKAMTSAELEAVFAAGLNVFAIYQDNDPVVSYYTEAQGMEDGLAAVHAARKLGVPLDAFIYFAVDCDMMDYQVTSNAIPYFYGVRKAMRSTHNMYRVGIYGSRNICTRVSKEGLAKSSFVADMSTGYSGNMGYPIPSNWAFDQFHEYVFTGATTDFDLDKDAYSGRYSGFGHVIDYPDDYYPMISNEVVRDRGEYLLNKMGIPVVANFDLGVPQTLSFQGVKITYQLSKNIEFDPANDAGVITIINGQKTETDATLVQDKFNGLSEKLQAMISDDGTLSIATVFENEIGDGKIAFWYEYREGIVTANFEIEEELWKTDNPNKNPETLRLTIKIEFSDNKNYSEEFANLKQLKPDTELWFYMGFFLLCGIFTAGVIASGSVGLMGALAVAL